MKDESGGKMMTEFVVLRPKMDDNEKKQQQKKGTNKCAIKRKITFDDYRNCLEVTQLENKINWLKNLM